MPDPSQIRNFSIIAHIDHGKTTLSDRLLQMTGAVEQREMHEQMLDDMDLERERGITIKARGADATQGVEAQTLANSYLAINNNLAILPVINKVDLPSAEPERVREQIENVIGLDAHDAVLASAKAGIGVKEILEKIITHIPAPKGDKAGPLRALLFDS